MKKIGIIGGIGPESTVDYYKLILTAFRDRTSEWNYPEIIIYSANISELMHILEHDDMPGLTEWLVHKVLALHAAGAEFAVIGSNTPHVVFDEVRARSPIPMLSIVEETCTRADELGLKQLGLLGTAFTMKSDFFRKPFREKGMAVVVPDENDQKLIHHRLFSEIELGIIKESTREELLSVVRRMIEAHSIDGIILGCTELPLILTNDEYGVPFLNTTAIHAESMVKYSMEL
ncbi:MAG: amino acid racemase [Thermodesulfobacteriota bacterium]